MTDNSSNFLSMLLGLRQPFSYDHPGTQTEVPPAADAIERGIGLGRVDPVQVPTPAHVPSAPSSMVSYLELLLSEEYAVDRLIRTIGLDGLMAVLAERFDVKTVRLAAGRIKGARLNSSHFAIRRALACFCEEFGIKGENAAAKALAPFFTSNRIDTYGEQRANSIRKALAQARKRCADNPVLEQVARDQAVAWRKQHPEQDITHALRGMRSHWKIQSPF